MQLTIAKNREELHEILSNHRSERKRIALVPTMGALHAGHAALITRARELAEIVVVSIFVNPTQFGPNEDFLKYPRMLEEDCKLAEKAGVAVVYAPKAEDLYPAGFSTSISIGTLSTILCGKTRLGHFDGVATVVAKLLLSVMPNIALFGEKDYQQLCVINRMVADLNIPVEVVGVPIVREENGLAMSSRNAYLTLEERHIAPMLYIALQEVKTAILAGSSSAEAISSSKDTLTTNGFKVDYLELRHANTLETLKEYHSPARLLIAAWLGSTRLIDNIAID